MISNHKIYRPIAFVFAVICLVGALLLYLGDFGNTPIGPDNNITAEGMTNLRLAAFGVLLMVIGACGFMITNKRPQRKSHYSQYPRSNTTQTTKPPTDTDISPNTPDLQP